ncbi:NAD-dependent succinate-semialdehyde dehydrogenase [Aggregatimonas sangjinii]|uniref:NAD-dependent succinate-semialdehyde dehydrogenase n=1 Tax=Aggregatimonas sangjinii TaxID=2583587 RepID=A0A5B7SY11_9FLAO|nr:NAD-dependent succinate-semialdehyde dehydrogenase [Aggregatimonas sangjinii]QCX01978.1 NAD-dependent succinate-semialdehyde dehydrogenase [Aggregatimonas sangjinii]
MIETKNPADGTLLKTYEEHTAKELKVILGKADEVFTSWKSTEIAERTELLQNAANILGERKQDFSELMTKEMGKPISQSIAEIEKCIWACEFYAVNAEDFLADELIDTYAEESFISYDPLGCILGIMPWNFPFWQVIRFAAPTLTAGNTILLKHAANVTGCAFALQQLFEEAGYPKGCFQTIVAGHDDIEKLIANDSLKAVTLTGSEKAGKAVAAIAAKHLKKSVLELGGNNACVIWEDADLKNYIEVMVNARMQNNGQSCIAAKRFIVVDAIYDEFLKQFERAVSKLQKGDAMQKEAYITVLATSDIADTVEKQVNDSIAMGARVHFGNTRDHTYFEPTILTEVVAGMPVFDQEVFGPVAAVIRAKDRDDAIALATNSRFGLGTMLFTEDIAAARKTIGSIPDGSFFINDMVKSDPRLPFGGTKASGYGRELSQEGIMEFVNKKTVYIKK